MKFSDKLNILFNISNSKGKELANAMYVTPPQISKMRKGLRGIPRNRDTIFAIALFFAQHINTSSKKTSLAKEIKLNQIINIENESELTEIIYEWLSNDYDNNMKNHRTEIFLKNLDSLFNNDESENKKHSYNTLLNEKNNFFTYYGNEGKRVAVLNFINYLIRRKQPYIINLLTDESLNWSTDDPTFPTEYQEGLLTLISQGCTFRRISTPAPDMNQAFDSLTRWLPLYITGKATSYYYRRLRDNLNKITIFVVPDIAVLFSFSVGSNSENNNITFFTTDIKTVNIMYLQFETYFNVCEPVLTVHRAIDSLKTIHNTMLKYESIQANTIQLNNSLSFITLPWDIAQTLNTKSENDKTNFLYSFAQRYKTFKSNLDNYTFVDIIRLANIKNVLKGEVIIPGSKVLSDNDRFYTPYDYLYHLKSIKYLHTHIKNYYLIILHDDNIDQSIMYLKENNCTIIGTNTYPFSLFEASERNLVNAFQEHLNRIISPIQDVTLTKNVTLIELNAYIKDLESKLVKNI